MMLIEHIFAAHIFLVVYADQEQIVLVVLQLLGIVLRPDLVRGCLQGLAILKLDQQGRLVRSIGGR